MKVKVELKVEMLDGEEAGKIDIRSHIADTVTMCTEYGIIEQLRVEWKYLHHVVERKATTKTGRWTPVSEGLPKEHVCNDGYIEPSDPVLITTKSGNITVSRYWGSRRSKITEESEERGPKYYDWVDAELWEDDVIAWMPLPLPYRISRERGMRYD